MKIRKSSCLSLLCVLAIPHYYFDGSLLFSKAITSVVLVVLGYSFIKSDSNSSRILNFKVDINLIILTLSILVILIGLAFFDVERIRYLLQALQVISFSIIAYNLSTFDDLKASLRFRSLVNIAFIFTWIILIAKAALFSGCIACLSNYVIGQRNVPGLNTIGNSLISLLLLDWAISLKIMWLRGNGYFHSISIKTLLYAIALISLNTRQTALCFCIFLVVRYIYEFLCFPKRQPKNSSQSLFINRLAIASLISILLVKYDVLVSVSMGIVNTVIQRTQESIGYGANFIRVQQISIGIKMFSENPLFGSNFTYVQQNLNAVGTTVFENSYIDILSYLGVFPLFILSILLLYICADMQRSNRLGFLVISIPLLVMAAFNEILTEPLFWIPIIYYYGWTKNVNAETARHDASY